MFKKEETEECREPKQDFFVEAQKLEDFPADYRIKKVGKLSSSQSVKLSSNAVGRITSIKVKEGQSVKSGQLLATLADNIGSYNLNVERASNAISRAKINYDSQKIALDKQVADSNLLLARLGKNLVNLEKTNAQNITRNMNDSENINSEASLEKIELSVAKIEQNMEKIAQNIEKLELDAENVKMSNRETINGFRSTILSEQNSLRLSLDDIIEFADEILGVTPENEDENDRIDSYL
jgi:multidrug efflux pump subunit AcrA (membrane-fusion protein)